MNTIDRINAIVAPYSLKVDDIIRSSQTIRYKLYLPLDVKAQAKIKRATKDIEYCLTTALQTNEFSLIKDTDSLCIECKSDHFDIVPFSNFVNTIISQPGLKLALGQDQNGQKLFTDLSKAPHILVAGTTGSGKSELLHTFIASLINDMYKMPIDLIIIDPKRAEYSVYKDCKNIRLVTDMDKAALYLKAIVDIMEERYAELEKNGAKDIYKYTGTMAMDSMVVVIDELADLILTHKEIEKDIVRIAQKARACGIHLILGTQRPTKDVITGLIKANIPTRIALKTVSSLESRIILDRNGADKLCGRGDMLYLGNGAFNTIRIQSPYVTESEKKYLASKLARQKGA